MREKKKKKLKLTAHFLVFLFFSNHFLPADGSTQQDQFDFVIYPFISAP